MKLYNGGRLNLEPAFQRKSVWTTRDRQRLLVSVFDGIPLPSVYLYKRVDARSGLVEYDVIDGKQRLESLMLFAGEGPLADVVDRLRFRGDLDGQADLAWRYWDDVGGSHKRQFRETRIPVITVVGELSEIAELFVSINSTGKKLTGQERRHAFYDHSNVLKAASLLAETHRRTYEGLGVFSKTQMDRMLHIEFTTELLLYAYNGSHLNKKTKLDEVIRGDMLDAALLRRAANDVGQALRMAEFVMLSRGATRFKRRADFYSLVTLLLQFKAEGMVIQAVWSKRNDLARDLLTQFGLGVDEVSSLSARARPAPNGYQQHTKYLMTVREGTDSAAQRKKRAAILAEVLAGVFDAKDTRRTFNEEQRRILWNRNFSKECAICGDRIAAWPEMNADHIQAYVRGGSTSLGNGAITHKRCNQLKGAR